MKKFLGFLMLIVLMILTACGKSSGTTAGSTGTTSTTAGSTATQSTNTDTTGTTGTVQHRQASLTFASWGDATFSQKMIDKFMEKYPWITVTLDQTITGTGAAFTQNLVAAAQAGTIPDVFAIDNVPTGIDKGILLDVAPYWNADPDTAKIYPNIAATGKYGDVRYAIPSFQFIKGVFINKTLFEDAGYDLPAYDWKYDEMVQLARDLTDNSNYMYGIGGLNFDAMLPAEDNASVGYHTWNGNQFNFSSQAWIDASNLMRDLRAEGVEEAMTGDEKQAEFGNTSAWPFYEGHTYMQISASWDLPYLLSGFESKGYQLGFWPYPGGDAGQRIPLILDYYCVSKQTYYPEEAYLLAKWMSWGEDGWNARIQIMKDMKANNEVVNVNELPVADYPQIWSELENMAGNVDGFAENIALVKDGVPDTDKWLPGYNDFWAWLGSDTNPNKDQLPTMTPEQFAPIWQENMNRLINEAYAKYGLQK